MLIPVLLALSLVQAPAAAAQGTQLDEDIRTLALSGAPVLARGIEVTVQETPGSVALREGRVDAWGCVAGSYICRHESAVVQDGMVIATARAYGGARRCSLPNAASLGEALCEGQLPGCGNIQCQLFYTQRLDAWEFERTNVGLRTGKALAADRAARDKSTAQSRQANAWIPPASSAPRSSGSAAPGRGSSTSGQSARPSTAGVRAGKAGGKI